MRDRSSWENNRRKGFTTVEVIVVMVLVLIMAGGLILGIIKWVDWTNFKRQNEYARTLFVAAENQLTEYAQSGQLEELSEKLENARTIDDLIESGELTGQQGQVYSLKDIWPESRNKGVYAHRYQGDIVSVIVTPEDYVLYMQDKLEETDLLEQEKTAIYDLIYSYLYDPAILKATVCIELAPEEGQVFSVLYSDKKTNFTYGTDEDGGRRGTASIRSREGGFRNKRMVGYYGVDCLSQATGNRVEKPSLSEIRLNNEETLNLSFVVEKAEIGELNYELTIHDKITKRPVLSFSVDGSKLKNEMARETVRCDVTRYTYEGEESVTKTSTASFPILAWTSVEYGSLGNSRPMIHVVLDAADLDATSEVFASYIKDYEMILGNEATTDLGGYLGGFADTLSFHRFGVITEDIYCTVKASGQFYKTSAKKQSNSENTYFGSYRENAGESGQTEIQYALKNARHLYNMRYIEDFGEDKYGTLLQTIYGREMNSVTYQLEENIDWETFQSDSHALFQSGAESRQETIESFPAIRLLRNNSVMESEGAGKYTIRGLKVVVETQEAAGLILCNEGTLRNFALDDITVTGSQNVGAFCGINRGTLDKVTVKNTGNKSTITGSQNVGGIAGTVDFSAESDSDKKHNSGKKTDSDEKTETGETASIHYQELENYACVCGISDHTGKNNGNHQNNGQGNGNKKTESGQIGGIFGYLSSEKTTATITVKHCKNYGQIRAMENEVLAVGGIVGKCDAEGGGILLSDCTSSPWYSEEELQELLEVDENEEINGLKGSCIGGIIGWNKGGIIRNCTTRKYGDREGYILGNRYVGGIIGYCESTDNEPVIVDGGENGVNEAHVLGNYYVGGVSGMNQAGCLISGWKNRGFVGAVREYSGGITGWNAGENDSSKTGGEIANCDSTVPNNTAVRTLSDSGIFVADFSGGIAGYNNGAIHGDKMLSIESNVTGNHFVGGVVGYNDIDGEITELKVIGGYVKGTGSFVGGFAGFNASKSLLTGEEEGHYLESNPNQVEGEFCVGGTIGGNIVPTDKNINTVFYSDDFHGKLTAKGAVAGGFIGYSQLLNGNKFKKNYTDKLMKSVRRMVEDLSKVSDLSEIVDLEKYFHNDFSEFGTSEYSMIIQGKEDDSDTQTELGGITGGIYVGGVIGYNAADTKLTVKNVVNLTPVKATVAVENEKEQPKRKDYEGNSFKYSYAGGIIGKVNENTVIDSCRNQDAGNDVTTEGTYKGGICEVNEGQVANCYVSDTGSRTMDYVGGITGLNKEKGIIRNTIFNDQKIIGRNYVGGITAENFGEITGTEIQSGKVQAYGTKGIVGGIAGVNEKDAVIRQVAFGGGEEKYHPHFDSASSSEMGQTVSINNWNAEIYVGTGNRRTTDGYTGGVAGINSGRIENIDTASVNESTLLVENYRGNVGGVVGYNKSTGIVSDVETGKNWLVFAPQNAQNYGCGGIIGYEEGENGLSRCKNRATVVNNSDESNGVGGMVGRMEMTAGRKYQLQYCENYGTIDGYRGCGGMIGVWKGCGGTLSDCVNYGTILTRADQGCAGMVGCFYETTKEVIIERCVNHGKIWGSSNHSCGGIVGYSQNDNLLLSLKDCVNTGLIREGVSNSGITAISDRLSSRSTIIRCRNYGYAFLGDYDNLNGIAPNNLTQNVTVEECFNLSDLRFPLVNQTGLKEKNNYYLVNDGNQDLKSDFGKNEDRDSGIGNKCRQETNEDQTFRLMTDENTQLGISGFSRSLLDLFNREEAKQDNSLIACGDEKDNLRYVIYQQDDPYINANVTQTVDAPTAPTNIKITDSGEQRISLNASSNEQYYQYEVEYSDENETQLNVPEVSCLKADESMAYDKDKFVTLEQLDNGMKMTYQSTESKEDVQGNYQLAAAIFAQRQDGDLSKVQSDGDHKEEKDGCWNEGALATLYTKAFPQEMSGDFDLAEYVLQHEALKDYGGKWLKIVMRSVSDNAISSPWSDEDEDGETENYCWIQIPGIQVKTPALRKEVNLLFYNGDGKMDQESETALPVYQTALEFDSISHADGYRIRMVRKGKDSLTFDNNNATPWYADRITLHKTSDGFDVMFATTDPAVGIISGENWSETNLSGGGEGHLLGHLRPGEKLFLPIIGKVAGSAGNRENMIQTAAFLMLGVRDGQSYLLLQLPDAEKVNGVLEGFEENADLYTRQVSVQPLVTEQNNRTGYESGIISHWYRRNNEESGQVELTMEARQQ